MAVKPITQRGKWVCVEHDRAFAHKTDTGRVVPLESTHNGWNLTVAFEAQNDANWKLKEVMETMSAETTFGTDRKSIRRVDFFMQSNGC